MLLTVARILVFGGKTNYSRPVVTSLFRLMKKVLCAGSCSCYQTPNPAPRLLWVMRQHLIVKQAGYLAPGAFLVLNQVFT
jgi:hypothetical protein